VIGKILQLLRNRVIKKMMISRCFFISISCFDYTIKTLVREEKFPGIDYDWFDEGRVVNLYLGSTGCEPKL